ncbi:MAG: DUF2924 domain-containing protein [Rhodospirillaceae bacterium]|nr:DUF2924 domain-containing protein [Rhodospirillaceae bacterium]
MARLSSTEMAAKLAAIPSMTRAELAQVWLKAFGQLAPKGLSHRLLAYALAYHLQVKTLGGLSTASKRLLAQAAQNCSHVENGRSTKPLRKRLGPGTRIVREWHGRTYTVDVLDQGYAHEGRTYRSLSEIARAITGTRWSGPRFFAP